MFKIKQESTYTLGNKNWDRFYELDNVDQQWQEMLTHILETADSMCPIREHKFKKQKPEYLTPDMVEMMRERDHFYKKAKRTGCSDDWNIAKYWRNLVKSNIKTSKAHFIKSQLDSNNKNPSKFWRVINKVFPNKRDISLQRVTVFNYLGILLDEHLTFENHIKKTMSRVSAKILQLRKLRQYITDKAGLIIYKNMILPILEYGDLFLTSATVDLKKKLQTLQNKAFKCALEKDRRYSTKQVHIEAKLLNLKTRRKLHILQHMFRISRRQNFKGWKKRHTNVVTRQNNKKLMIIKKPNTTAYQNSLAYQGPKLWNSLTLYIQDTPDMATFKNKTLAHLQKVVQNNNNNNDNDNVSNAGNNN